MKLSKIYASDARFKPITFKDGLNVIYGDVVASISLDTNKSHEHNLGKTALVHLIDFMLLKGVARGQMFYKHKKKFFDWTFFLEIQLNNGHYLTIRRAVNPNTKISFKEHFVKHQDFSRGTAWDHEDLALGAKADDELNPKNVLSRYLDFDVAKEYSYRSYLGYLLRDQYEYGDVFKLSKFEGSDAGWKPALLSLLGFSPKELVRKYALETERSDENRIISRLQGEDVAASEEVYRIRAAIEAKEAERDHLRAKVGNFDFYEKEQDLNVDLVKNIETQIASLNKKEYSLNYNLEQIQISLDSANVAAIKFDDIKKVFEESELYFPDALTKEYEEVERFGRSLTAERNKYLKDQFADLQQQLGEVKSQLEELNSRRSETLALLGEKDTFTKYQAYQENLVKVETDIARYRAQLENAETIEKYQASLDKIEVQIKEKAMAIKGQLDSDNTDYQNIKKLFRQYFRAIVNFTAVFAVEMTKTGNVRFETAVLNSADDITGMDDGYTFKKTLCACFALAILANYSQKSFFRFAYHDGVMESSGNNPKNNFLSMAREAAIKNNFQYIVSVIKSDVPANMQFEEGEVRRILSEQDTLFGMEF
jgi:uncharacterized protein YydD (DUF2326 family)